MTTIESLLSWESRKLDSLANESGDVAKVISVFREFLLTVGDERQRFAEERGVLTQQAKDSDLNAEKRCTELQNKLFELSSKLNQETIQKDELVSNSERSQNEVADLKKKLDAYLAEKSEATFKLQSLESDSTSLKLKLEDALRRLHYKEEELKRLNGEWESVSAKESAVSKLQAEARSKLSDVESREVSLKFREERLNQEKVISEELQQKVQVVMETIQHSTQEYCSYEELERKVVFDSGVEGDEKFREVVEMVCRYCVNVKRNPHWMGKLYGGASEASFLAELLIAYYNNNVHVFHTSPLFTFAEEQILKKVIGYVGYDDGQSNGIFLPGGSISTLIGMVLARYKMYPDSKEKGISHPIQVITSKTSHYSIDKNSVMMGIGTENVLKIDFASTSPKQLDEILTKNNVFMINSTFGTTSEGFMEDLEKFSKVIKKHNVWHHIDACIGGIALFSKKYRYLTESFRDADSITIDCHKMLNINQQCSVLLVKEGSLLEEASSVTAPYLFHEDSERDIARRSFFCSRKPHGFKLWFCDQVDDLDSHVTMLYDRTPQLKAVVAKDKRFQPENVDSMTHICFKIVSTKEVDIHEITTRLRKEGIFLEYSADYFRLVPVNKEITAATVENILDRIIDIHSKI